MRRGRVTGYPGMSWQYAAGMRLRELERQKAEKRGHERGGRKSTRQVAPGSTIDDGLRSQDPGDFDDDE